MRAAGSVVRPRGVVDQERRIALRFARFPHGDLQFPTWILRELGSGWIAASSTWAVAARNFGLAFICASLRRDYPIRL